MERLFTNSHNYNHLSVIDLAILSYHRFFEEESDYPFSRTYKQFANDLGTKDFDWITIDDGHLSIIKACEMMREKNFRAKLFISTSLVGTKGYCSWDELWKLSRFHDIENHSHNHVYLSELTPLEIKVNIDIANEQIKKHIGVKPRYFVPPFNTYSEWVFYYALDAGLTPITDRVDIRNISR